MSKSRKRQRAKRRKQTTTVAVIGALVLIGAAAAVLSLSGNSQDTDTNADQVAPAVGFTAPDFTLTDVSGNPSNLSDYRGQLVALSFMHTW